MAISTQLTDMSLRSKKVALTHSEAMRHIKAALEALFRRSGEFGTASVKESMLLAHFGRETIGGLKRDALTVYFPVEIVPMLKVFHYDINSAQMHRNGTVNLTELREESMLKENGHLILIGSGKNGGKVQDSIMFAESGSRLKASAYTVQAKNEFGGEIAAFTVGFLELA